MEVTASLSFVRETPLQGLFQLRGTVVLVFQWRAGVQGTHRARPPEAVGMERQGQV